MHYVASQLVDYLIEKEITSSDMREEHTYGFEVMIGKILNYGTLLLISCVNHNLICTLFFMVTFFSLRGRTGGYHSKNPWNCYVGTLIIYFLVSIVISPALIENVWMLVSVVGFSIISIFLFSPVNHPDLELDEEEVKLCRSSSRWLVMLISLCVFISIWLDIIPVYISYVVAGMGMDAGLLILAKGLKQEVKKNEKNKRKGFKSYG